MYELVKSKLESHPDFRERRFRSKYLAILALRETGLEQRVNCIENIYKNDIEIKKGEMIRPLNLSEMADFAIKYSSLEREWRNVLMNEPHLRGTDYEKEKTNLEQEKQLELGYEVGYFADIKNAKKL